MSFLCSQHQRLGEKSLANILPTDNFKDIFCWLRIYINAAAFIELQDEDGYTILHHAAEQGKHEVIRLFLAFGANVNATTHNRDTPLHKAALFGREDAALVLLNAGADVRAINVFGKTPLDRTENREVAQLIEAHGGKRRQCKRT